MFQHFISTGGIWAYGLDGVGARKVEVLANLRMSVENVY